MRLIHRLVLDQIVPAGKDAWIRSTCSGCKPDPGPHAAAMRCSGTDVGIIKGMGGMTSLEMAPTNPIWEMLRASKNLYGWNGRRCLFGPFFSFLFCFVFLLFDIPIPPPYGCIARFPRFYADSILHQLCRRGSGSSGGEDVLPARWAAVSFSFSASRPGVDYARA